jgi:hypothetical protein
MQQRRCLWRGGERRLGECAGLGATRTGRHRIILLLALEVTPKMKMAASSWLLVATHAGNYGIVSAMIVWLYFTRTCA